MTRQIVLGRAETELRNLIPESPRTSPQQDFPMDGVNGPPLPPFADPHYPHSPHYKEVNHTTNATTRELPTVNFSLDIKLCILL